MLMVTRSTTTSENIGCHSTEFDLIRTKCYPLPRCNNGSYFARISPTRTSCSGKPPLRNTSPSQNRVSTHSLGRLIWTPISIPFTAQMLPCNEIERAAIGVYRHRKYAKYFEVRPKPASFAFCRGCRIQWLKLFRSCLHLETAVHKLPCPL